MGFSTKLQLVNYVLKLIGHAPVSALDSTGSWPSKTYGVSDAGQVESYLDMFTRAVLQRQWQQTASVFTVTLSPAGTITLPTNTIKCVPIGRDENRNWYMQNGSLLVYDGENRTTTFAANTYQFKIVEDAEISTLSDNDLQMLCAKRAADEYNAATARLPQVKQHLDATSQIHEISAARPPTTVPRPGNSVLIPAGNNGQ